MFRVLCVVSIISMFLPLVEIKSVIKKRSENKDALRVVNGQPATPGQFYYMVSLKRRIPVIGQNVYMGICGGSLIATSVVLTAAHCVERDGNECQSLCRKAQFYPPRRFQVVAGSLFNVQEFEANGQWRSLRSIAPHKGYWVPKKDVAILHTKQPFVFDDNVKAIPFASSKFIEYGNIECKVAGFGRTDYADPMSDAAVLMWANLQLLSVAQCSKRLSENMQDFVCTSSAKTDVLQGDSGGALVCTKTGDKNDKGEGVIVGIACAIYDGQSIFTRISSYSDFIARGESEASYPIFYIVWLTLAVSNVYKSAFMIN